jgi:hypothetical protein
MHLPLTPPCLPMPGRPPNPQKIASAPVAVCSTSWVRLHTAMRHATVTAPSLRHSITSACPPPLDTSDTPSPLYLSCALLQVLLLLCAAPTMSEVTQLHHGNCITLIPSRSPPPAPRAQLSAAPPPPHTHTHWLVVWLDALSVPTHTPHPRLLSSALPQVSQWPCAAPAMSWQCQPLCE